MGTGRGETGFRAREVLALSCLAVLSFATLGAAWSPPEALLPMI